MTRIPLPWSGQKSGAGDFSALLRRSMASGFLLSFSIFMSVLAMLAGGLGLSAHAWGQAWSDALTHGVTIEIVDGAAIEGAAIDALRDDLTRTGFVTRLDPLSADQIGTILKPWLGNVGRDTLDQLPLPVLMDGVLRDDQPATLAALQDRLSQWAQQTNSTVHVTRHQEWLGGIQQFILLSSVGGWAIFFAVLVLSALATAVIIQAQIVAHHEDIAILTILGATDGFIAGQFCRAIAALCAQASVIGCLTVGVGAFILLAFFTPAATQTVSHLIGPFVILSAIIGVFLTGLSMLAAHLTVHYELRGNGHVRL